MSDNEFFDKMVGMIQQAYIEVYGIEKWISLTDQQKHDAVMIIVRDMHRALA